ncbi:hypothetical protein HPB47_009129 [Ixodes persulcatus]|uniref:Uncharacterized protein n=1 Tax=Ixodes persulcatus TaxID=34615 RepID=A0AC60P2W5_IXOPE|nr:hypothetical protein HPB47_009129 [Ixodes persulcatus]
MFPEEVTGLAGAVDGRMEDKRSRITRSELASSLVETAKRSQHAGDPSPALGRASDINTDPEGRPTKRFRQRLAASSGAFRCRDASGKASRGRPEPTCEGRGGIAAGRRLSGRNPSEAWKEVTDAHRPGPRWGPAGHPDRSGGTTSRDSGACGGATGQKRWRGGVTAERARTPPSAPRARRAPPNRASRSGPRRGGGPGPEKDGGRACGRPNRH